MQVSASWNAWWGRSLHLESPRALSVLTLMRALGRSWSYHNVHKLLLQFPHTPGASSTILLALYYVVSDHELTVIESGAYCCCCFNQEVYGVRPVVVPPPSFLLTPVSIRMTLAPEQRPQLLSNHSFFLTGFSSPRYYLLDSIWT